jgi:hypothetical protein
MLSSRPLSLISNAARPASATSPIGYAICRASAGRFWCGTISPARRRRCKFTDRLDVVEDQAEAHLKVPYPTQLSLWEEAAMDGIGLVTSWLDQFPVANERKAGDLPAAA